jgi:hypothetical protein
MKATMKIEFERGDVEMVLREYVENKYGKAPDGYEYRAGAARYETTPRMVVEAFEIPKPSEETENKEGA